MPTGAAQRLRIIERYRVEHIMTYDADLDRSRGIIPPRLALEAPEFRDTLWPYQGVMPVKRAACFIVFAFLSALLPAQSTFGTILGTVTDASGALVPGVQVSRNW